MLSSEQMMYKSLLHAKVVMKITDATMPAMPVTLEEAEVNSSGEIESTTETY